MVGYALQAETTLYYWKPGTGKGGPCYVIQTSHLHNQAATAVYTVHEATEACYLKPICELASWKESTADFGIAKFITTTSATSQNIRGTPTYMAPEQWLSKSVPQTDQYALAVMTYELLTGQAPFQGGMAQMMYQHLNVTPPAPGCVHAGRQDSRCENYGVLSM